MKIIKTFALVLMAALAFSLVSCETEIDNLIPQEGNYVTVNLGIGGEYIELDESPLVTKVDHKSDIYAIQVHTVTDGMMTTPYAQGVFTSLDNISIKLLEGSKYKFAATIVLDADIYDKGDGYVSCELGMIGTEFQYSTSHMGMIDQTMGNYERIRFYGQLENYTPTQDATVTIDTKRTVYGAHFIAEGLTEGQIEVKVGGLYTKTLTPANYEYDGVFSFSSLYSAWYGTYDMPASGHLVDYFTTKQISINWTKDDGSITPLGTYSVTFRRNVKTTIRIKAEDAGAPNGIFLTREDAPMVDDDKEYLIEGGKVTEVPVRDQI
jgi:hypothetical protein